MTQNDMNARIVRPSASRSNRCLEKSSGTNTKPFFTHSAGRIRRSRSPKLKAEGSGGDEIGAIGAEPEEMRLLCITCSTEEYLGELATVVFGQL